MIRLAIVFLLFGAQSALACPQAPDPEHGLVLTRTEPFFQVVSKSTDRGWIEQRIMERGGELDRASTVYPHPLAVGERTDKNGTLSIRYSAAVSELDHLDETGLWRSDVVLLSGQNVLDRGTATRSFLGRTKFAIGWCVYDVWLVEARTVYERHQPTVFDQYYSPELGVILESIKLTPDREPITRIGFNEIEVGRPSQ